MRGEGARAAPAFAISFAAFSSTLSQKSRGLLKEQLFASPQAQVLPSGSRRITNASLLWEGLTAPTDPHASRTPGAPSHPTRRQLWQARWR